MSLNGRPTVVVSASQVVKVGLALRARLERLAPDEGRDVTSLVTRILTDYVTEKEQPK